MRKAYLRGIAACMCIALAGLLTGCVTMPFSSLRRTVRVFDGTPTTRTFDGAFTEVVLRYFETAVRIQAGERRIDVTYVRGDAASIAITAPEDMFDTLDVTFRDGAATIEGDRNISYDFDDCALVITAPTLADVELSGAIIMSTMDDIRSDKLNMTFNGAADITAGFQVKDLEITLNGAGNAALSGSAEDFEMTLNGAADVDAKDLAAGNVTVRLNGAGGAKVSASETLDASIAGAGNITYYGSPSVKQSVAGLGSVTRGNE